MPPFSLAYDGEHSISIDFNCVYYAAGCEARATLLVVVVVVVGCAGVQAACIGYHAPLGLYHFLLLLLCVEISLINTVTHHAKSRFFGLLLLAMSLAKFQTQIRRDIVARARG